MLQKLLSAADVIGSLKTKAYANRGSSEESASMGSLHRNLNAHNAHTNN